MVKVILFNILSLLTTYKYSQADLRFLFQRDMDIFRRPKLPSEFPGRDESFTYPGPAVVKSLVRQCLNTVIQHPALVEEISSLLPQHLRGELLAKCLELKKTDCLIPLFYTWSSPILSLEKLCCSSIEISRSYQQKY